MKQNKSVIAGKYKSFVILTHCIFSRMPKSIAYKLYCTQGTIFNGPFCDKNISLRADVHHALPFTIKNMTYIVPL